MARSTLVLRLDEPGRLFRPGEPVRGRVGVVIEKDCRVDPLTVRWAWFASGGEPPIEEPAGEMVLFRGQWHAGQRSEYAFEFPAPPGPLSYQGRHLVVGWILRAHADIPWALDSQAEVAFDVGPGDDPWGISLGPGFSPPTPEPVVTRRSAVRLPARGKAGVAAVAVGTLLLVSYIPDALGLPVACAVSGCTRAFVGGWALGAGMVMLVDPLRGLLSGQVMDEATLALSSVDRIPGDRFTATVRLLPFRRCTVEEAHLRLECDEAVTTYQEEHDMDGDTRSVPRTFHHSVFLKDLPLDVGLLRPGHALDFSGRFRVPADAPATFVAHHHTVTWTVSVSLRIQRWPDWSLGAPLVVRPCAPGGRPTDSGPRRSSPGRFSTTAGQLVAEPRSPS